jgi:phospholipid/cholesterol/gamma-HCH transport system permease protein
LRNCALICPVGVFDLNQLGALDTAGATLLALLLGEDRVANLRELAPKLPEERRILLETVSHVLPDLTLSCLKNPHGFGLRCWLIPAVR